MWWSMTPAGSMLFGTAEQPSGDKLQREMETFFLSGLSRLGQVGSLVCESEGGVVSLSND